MSAAERSPRKRRSPEEIAASKAEKAARADARAQRLLERAARIADCAAIRQRLASETVKPPPEYQAWGSVRTQAWLAACGVARKHAQRASTTPKAHERLQLAAAALSRACTAPVDQLTAPRSD